MSWVGDLNSKTRKKFDEWFEKVSSNLKRQDEAILSELPSDCRFLRYWAEKLRREEPEIFAKKEKAYMSLNSQVGQQLHGDYMNYLTRAERHRKGTKVRLNEILRYVYYYGNYAHECLIEGGAEEYVRNILKFFWDVYGTEIMKYGDRLEDFQISSVLRLARQSSNLGIEIQNQLISALEDMIRLPDPVLIARCKTQLKKAEKNLNEEETITALVLADQSLELLLRDLCTRFGCDENTSSRTGKPFMKWGFTEYVAFLAKIGEIDRFEKGNFFRFHEWRNATYHLGLEPSVRVVRMVIDEIAKFLDEHSY